MTKKTETSEVKTQAPQAVVAAASKAITIAPPAQDHQEEIVTKDLQIPRILLSQATSDRVKERKCLSGDYVLTQGDRVLAKQGEPLKIIPIKMRSTWVNYDMTTKRGEFKGIEARTNSNSNLPWTYTNEDGTPMKRVQCVEVYGLLPDQILAFAKTVKAAEESGEIPDLSLIPTPVGIGFQSTSFKYAGKAVSQFFDQVRSAQIHFKNVRPFSYVLTFKAIEDSADDDTWLVSTLEKQEQVAKVFDKDEAKIIYDNCLALADKMSSSNVVMDSDETQATSGASDVVSDLI
jgi:hypothetical protein